MRKDRMSQAYFDWMCHLVSDTKYLRGKSYSKLLRLLHGSEFIYILDMDGNRAADGADLRLRFAYEHSRSISVQDLYSEAELPCSIFEMMVALAVRCEEHIMDDESFGDRTSKWFWQMIISLGLFSLDDSRFNQRTAEDVLTIFLRREYEPTGRGGLFTVESPRYDMTTLEIWGQLMAYLDAIT